MFEPIIHDLAESYYNPALQLNHLRPSALPSRHLILQILDHIKNLLFPDHRLGHSLRNEELALLLGGRLAELHELLSEQIHLARSYALQTESEDGRERAAADAAAFMHRLPVLRAMLALDVQAAIDGDPAARSYDEIIFCYPGFMAIATQRIAHEL